MSYRLRLILMYKDGTNHELLIQCNPDVAHEIEKKGMMAAQIFVESNMQVTKPELGMDKFIKGSG